MKTLQLIAGTPEWHAHRATHFNASDAPAMLGCSPYMTRTQLLHKLHTGVGAEVDPATQRRFDDGHRFEALARPLAEEIIGDQLAPVVGTLGELSASFDGLTLMADVAFEHKTLNNELRAVLKETPPALPKHYRVQMEQQLLVSGAERVLFMASDWAGNDDLIEELHCWYEPDAVLRAEIVNGWQQFAADLAAYKPSAAAEVVHAAPIEALPAVSVQMQGTLTVHSNLDVFGKMLREFIDKIPAKPSTEQEFADCAAAVKALKRAEEALDAAEANALGQVASVETITRTIADLREVSATARKATDKLVEARKLQIRTEEVQRGKTSLAEFIADLNATIGKPYMPTIAADFAGAISGKKTVDSVRNAIDTELARAKIAASEVANTIIKNMATLRELAKDHIFLFADTASIVLKPCDDCRALVENRIAAHKQAEAEKEAATRERIRVEEESKARAQLAREQEARDREAAQQTEVAKPTLPPAAAPAAAPTLVSQAQAANSPSVGPMRAAPASFPTLKLGEINARLEHFTTSEAGLAALGFPATKVKGSCLYQEADFPRMVDSAIAHLRMVAEQQLQAA